VAGEDRRAADVVPCVADLSFGSPDCRYTLRVTVNTCRVMTSRICSIAALLGLASELNLFTPVRTVVECRVSRSSDNPRYIASGVSREHTV
jgi:hypothetical protein